MQLQGGFEKAMKLKQEHWIVGLIGLGAVAVFVFLWYESRQGQAAAVPAVPIGGGPQPQPVNQTYPNSLTPLNFEVGPSPVNLTYNTLPADYSATGVQVAPADSICGNGGCDGCGTGCDSCAQAQQTVSVQKVSSQVVQSATDNLNSYVSKLRSGGGLGLPAKAA